MNCLIYFLFLVMTMTCHAFESSLQGVCFAYNGSNSDKPIANVILVSNEDNLLDFKGKMLKGNLLVNRKLYTVLTVPSKVMDSFQSVEISMKKENKEGSLLIVLYGEDGLDIYRYPITEGLKIVRAFKAFVDDELKERIQRSFINRVEGLQKLD